MIEADVLREEDVKKIVSENIGRFGKIDILINNAGVIFRSGDWKTDIETYRKNNIF